MIHPPNQCSLELIKTFRTSLFHGRQMKPKRQTPNRRPGPLGPAHTLKCVSQEDPGAHQTHHRSQRFEHREYPCPPHLRGNTAPPYTVKKIQKLRGALPARCGFHATDVSNGGNQTAGWTHNLTVDGFNDWFTKLDASPFPPCSGCDIVPSGCEGWSHRRGVLPMAAE